jgi:hypothetical protein
MDRNAQKAYMCVLCRVVFVLTLPWTARKDRDKRFTAVRPSEERQMKMLLLKTVPGASL